MEKISCISLIFSFMTSSLNMTIFKNLMIDRCYHQRNKRAINQPGFSFFLTIFGITGIMFWNSISSWSKIHDEKQSQTKRGKTSRWYYVTWTTKALYTYWFEIDGYYSKIIVNWTWKYVKCGLIVNHFE